MPIIGHEYVSGEMAAAAATAGHGVEWFIADLSLDVDPQRTLVVPYLGRTAAQALRDSLLMVRREGPVTVMKPDSGKTSEEDTRALRAFYRMAADLTGETALLPADIRELPRLATDTEDNFGFYNLLHGETDARKIVVRTPDRNPYACAMFIVGHSQFGAMPEPDY